MKKINATGFFAGGLIALVLGAVIYWFVNIWVGLILALAAEIVFTMPKTLLQNAVKRENPGLDKLSLKVNIQEADKAEKALNGLYKACFIFVIVALAVVLGMIVLGSVLGVM